MSHTDITDQNAHLIQHCVYRAFSHDTTSITLVSQNNEVAAMLVFLTSPARVELFCKKKINDRHELKTYRKAQPAFFFSLKQTYIPKFPETMYRGSLYHLLE